MNGYVYIQSEHGLWTVGFHGPDGSWHPDSDWDVREHAARRVAFLNGGAYFGGPEDEAGGGA